MSVVGQERPRRARGERRRAQIVQAAAEIVLSEGPAEVTHRAVAARAGASLSSTTYYFSGLPDLLGAAAGLIAARWSDRAEAVRDALPEEVDRRRCVRAVLDALLPPSGEVRGHYLQLLGAGGDPDVARAYRSGRTRLEAAVADILARSATTCPAALAVAVVDGAVVSALSEGRDVRNTAAGLLGRVL